MFAKIFVLVQLPSAGLVIFLSFSCFWLENLNVCEEKAVDGLLKFGIAKRLEASNFETRSKRLFFVCVKLRADCVRILCYSFFVVYFLVYFFWFFFQVNSKKYGVDHIRFAHNNTNAIHCSTKVDGELLILLSLRQPCCLFIVITFKKKCFSWLLGLSEQLWIFDSLLLKDSFSYLFFLRNLKCFLARVWFAIVLSEVIRYLSLHDNKYIRYFPGHQDKWVKQILFPEFF